MKIFDGTLDEAASSGRLWMVRDGVAYQIYSYQLDREVLRFDDQFGLAALPQAERAALEASRYPKDEDLEDPPPAHERKLFDITHLLPWILVIANYPSAARQVAQKYYEQRALDVRAGGRLVAVEEDSD